MWLDGGVAAKPVRLARAFPFLVIRILVRLGELRPGQRRMLSVPLRSLRLVAQLIVFDGEFTSRGDRSILEREYTILASLLIL